MHFLITKYIGKIINFLFVNKNFFFVKKFQRKKIQRKMMKRMIPKNRLGRFFGSKVYQPQKDYGPVYHEYQKYKEITHKARQHNKKLYGEKQEQIDLEWISKDLPRLNPFCR